MIIPDFLKYLTIRFWAEEFPLE